MDINLATIKILREKTGAGMLDCQKALKESEGDMDKAIEILRKKGIAKAAKRGSKEASEGIIKIDIDKNKKIGYILQVNSESDFVARNEKFIDFVNAIMDLIKNNKPSSISELLSLKFNSGTVKDNLESLSGVIGEKLEIKSFTILESAGTVAAYSHMGGRIGVLVALNKPNLEDLAYNIAMQIAAAKPRYIKPNEIPEEEIEKEKDIYREQLKRENKPDNIIEKIIEGKIQKYYKEVCLLEQEYIKDDKQSVKDILLGSEVEKFIRYSL